MPSSTPRDAVRLSPNATTVLEKRYLVKDDHGKPAETPRDLFWRVARTIAEPDGCTAFAILPDASANGHLLLGQNWDWIPQVQGAVLHTTEPDGLETLAFTEAGIVGAKIGLNSAGLGLCINGMTTTDDDWSRLSKPFHVRCYEVLRARAFQGAVRVITEAPRSCSTNFLLAQTPDRVVDIEAAPTVDRRLSCEGGCLVHTNHFLDPDGMGLVEPPNERRPHSYHRWARMSELIGEGNPVRVDDLLGYLTDHEQHPFGLCRHEDWSEPPEEHYITVASVVMDLEEKTMLIADGPPCTNPHARFSLCG
jgi:isopenicillin-N N-acyltransferase-like protein